MQSSSYSVQVATVLGYSADGISATAVTDGELEEGRSLPIARARLMINRKWHTQPVEPGQEAAALTVELETGPALLHTWFDDERDQPICGAYYVYLARVG